MALKYADWARLVSMTSGIWTLWGAVWGLFYRKFFFDMIGATLGPTGLEPPPGSDAFIMIIVKLPIVQVIGIVTGLLLIAIDWPVPVLERTFMHRSHIFKICLLFLHSFVSIILYQAADSAVIAWIAMAIYLKAQILGEKVGGSKPGSQKQVGQV